jgi:hypothetical protein
MQRDSWSGALLAREAALNVFSPTSRLYPLLLLAVIAAVGLPLFSLSQAQQLHQELAVDALAGRNLVELTSLDQNVPARISRASCEGLTEDPDVVAAGIETQLGGADFVQLGTRVPVIGISPNLLPALKYAEVVVGSALAHPPGPHWLLMPDGTRARAKIGVPTPDAIGTNSAVAVTLPPSVRWASECTVIFSPLANATSAGDRVAGESADQ